MRKSLLILSVAAMSLNAMAQDTPEAGTAEAPNYYLIKANRGGKYLGYSAAGVTHTTAGTTHLVCTTAFDESNVWAVTPGTEEGTVVIKNYTADAYMMDFVKNGTPDYDLNSVANTVAAPVNVRIVAAEDAWSITIALPQGTSGYSALDTAGGETCGNWQVNDDGTKWWFTKLDVSNGRTVADALVQQAIQPHIAGINIYKAAVPQVANELQSGIEALKGLEYSDNLDESITATVNAAYANANQALATSLGENGHNYWVIKNVRRASSEFNLPPFVSYTDDSFVAGSRDSISANSVFKFEPVSGGGYKLLNCATNKYIGAGAIDNLDAFVPVDDASQAQKFTPMLYTNSGYSGLALVSEGSYGLSWQAGDNGRFFPYLINDGGSIWTIASATELRAAVVEDALTPYLPNVLPEIKAIFDAAIAESQSNTEDLFATADQIKAKAIEDANNYLATQLGDKIYGIKALRAGNFMAMDNVESSTFTHVANCDGEAAQYLFQAVGNGGYRLKNVATGAYVGPAYGTDAQNRENYLTIVENAESAITVYPVLNTNSGYYGISLPFDASKTGNGINVNSDNNLWSYAIGDGGSILALQFVKGADSSGIDEVSAAAPAVRGIFDLQGRRLSAPVKGICIINGKKVLVK